MAKETAKTNKKGLFDGIKQKAKEYKADIQAAYTLGYNQGWKDSERIPSRKGSKTAATVGYGNGLRDRKKSDKFNRKLKGGK